MAEATDSANPASLDPTSSSESDLVHFAVNGCCHGELNRIYSTILEAESLKGFKCQFLISCGDFQAIRSRKELTEMACPAKYRTMGDFEKYYSGKDIAPVLTLFVGGNHEGIEGLKENYFGGFLAENIYYMGHSAVVSLCGMTIAGLSGIFKGQDADAGYYETREYSEQSMRSAYHMRRFEPEKVRLYNDLRKKESMQLRGEESDGLKGGNTKTRPASTLSSPIDVIVTHDWPRGFVDYGDVESLLAKKDHTGQWRREIESRLFGNPLTGKLFSSVKPKLWLSGHMHAHYAAVIPHGSSSGHEIKSGEYTNSGEYTSSGEYTKFLALDKVIRGRPFLQFLTFNKRTREITGLAIGEARKDPADLSVSNDPSIRSTPEIALDSQWLKVLQITTPLISTSATRPSGPISDALLARSAPTDLPLPPLVIPNYNRESPLDYRQYVCGSIQVSDPFISMGRRKLESTSQAVAASSTFDASGLFLVDKFD